MKIIHPVTGEQWVAGKDGLIAPPDNPLRGRFGPTRRNADGSVKWHGGVDLSTYPGQPVFAAHDGAVTRAGEQQAPPPPGGGFGLRVYIQAPDGTRTCYAHLSGIAVKPRQSVRAGYLIGWAGYSGNADGEECHVHFGVKVAGRWVDPLLWSVGEADV